MCGTLPVSGFKCVEPCHHSNRWEGKGGKWLSLPAKGVFAFLLITALNWPMCCLIYDYFGGVLATFLLLVFIYFLSSWLCCRICFSWCQGLTRTGQVCCCWATSLAGLYFRGVFCWLSVDLLRECLGRCEECGFYFCYMYWFQQVEWQCCLGHLYPFWFSALFDKWLTGFDIQIK